MDEQLDDKLRETTELLKPFLGARKIHC
ncbi:MAG: hypothetical protein RLZZ562_2158, partial [Planctomycetota bacterium]